ncbi:hypothetical protein [Methanobrevibacter oralis]|uniref:Uncharacterized protein n=1 Tax=Methanobrevibacter oralis TaxID=66851 RepID=A0A166BZF5_METOA|nr:hypothetical protein [Methanobrevibacter oralis]KZX13972.1 hypothetical protein MBORA_02120 [Methanobrevibacter oralis]
MYSDEEKIKLMKDLKEMEEFKADVDDEGKLLQEDLIKFFVDGIGDKEDLSLRVELYLYAFKLFTRRSVQINKSDFVVYLNAYDVEYDLLKLVKNDLNNFEIVISTELENNNPFLNLNFILRY